MTVLAKYQRLEAEGLWRPDPEAQRRDVIVSIGDATLTIAAPNGAVLSHWSLPAILRTNPGKTPAVYMPGEDTEESLELSDTEMVEAIEVVLKAIRRGGAHPGRLRGLGLASGALVLLALLVFWLPGAITRYAASLVPEAAEAEIGQRLRTEVRRVTGAPCAEPSGLRALKKLEARLFPEGGTSLVVLPSALAETAHLPGGTILIGHQLAEDYEQPEALAGFILAENLRRHDRDPLEQVLSNAGLGAALKLLTTGRIGDGSLRYFAEELVAAEPAKVSDFRLIAAFTKAAVAAAPYAYARDISGESTADLIEASLGGEKARPVLDDGDWIALQRICEG